MNADYSKYPNLIRLVNEIEKSGDYEKPLELLISFIESSPDYVVQPDKSIGLRISEVVSFLDKSGRN